MRPSAQVAVPELDRCTSARDAIISLADKFPRFSADCVDVEEISPERMPGWASRLLVHEKHMTRVLTEEYGRKLDLYVMRERIEPPHYSRKIFLSPGTGRAVEYGLVRLDMRPIPPVARLQILTHQAPLGAVLMRHSPLREIQPRWFLRLTPESAFLRWMGGRLSGEAYGRIGVIWCDHRPAVEVLEIVPKPEEVR